jgi:hypothetical protein
VEGCGLMFVSARTIKRHHHQVVGVGDVVRGLVARALVWGDVDPHGGGLCARNADGGAIVIEVRASALFECLGDGSRMPMRVK